MPIPHRDQMLLHWQAPWQSFSFLSQLLSFFLGTSRRAVAIHAINRCLQSVFPVPKAANRSPDQTFRRLDELPTPSPAFFGQAISASLSSSPTSSATPSWVNTPHLPPSHPPSFSKGHFTNPYASTLAMLRCVPNLSTPPPAGLAPLSTLTTPKEPAIPLRTE